MSRNQSFLGSRVAKRKYRKPPVCANVFLTKNERIFLMMFSILSFVSLMSTSGAIFIDKEAITGTSSEPSICMLSDTFDCYTVYSSNTVRQIVEVSVRVDLLLSCISFTTAVILRYFKIFNGRLLVAFLLTAMFKMVFLSVAVLLILGNSGFYFNIFNSVSDGKCIGEMCLNDDGMNIVVAFLLLVASGCSTILMMITVFLLGSRILKSYEDSKNTYWA